MTRTGVILAIALLSALHARAQATAPGNPDQPRLEQRSDPRSAAADPPPVPLDARITAPVIIPTEAWGHFTFGRELDLLEADLEPQGLTGYITILGDKGLARGTDKTADSKTPLTFFFIKTRVGSDGVYFLTQQIHRVSYEFTGVMQQQAPRDRTLQVDYSLVGTLTLHHALDNGGERKESRAVVFKRVPVHLR